MDEVSIHKYLQIETKIESIVHLGLVMSMYMMCTISSIVYFFLKLKVSDDLSSS